MGFLATAYSVVIVADLSFWTLAQFGWKPPLACDWDAETLSRVGIACFLTVLFAALGLSSLLPIRRLPPRLRQVPGTMVWLSLVAIFAAITALPPHPTPGEALRRVGSGVAWGVVGASVVGVVASYAPPDAPGLFDGKPTLLHALLLITIAVTGVAGLALLYIR